MNRLKAGNQDFWFCLACHVGSAMGIGHRPELVGVPFAKHARTKEHLAARAALGRRRG